ATRLSQQLISFPPPIFLKTLVPVPLLPLEPPARFHSGRSFLIRKELPPRSTMSFPAARLCTTSLSTPPFQSSSLASVPLFPVTPLPVVAPYSFARSFRLSPPCPSQQLSSSAPPSPQPFSSIHTYPPLPPCSGRSFLIRKELPPLSTMSFPAAELFSTSLSTSIPNITVYVPGKSSWVTSLFIRIIQFAARVWPFTVLLEKAIRMLPTPDTTPGHRVNTGMACAGEVVDTTSNKRHRASVIVGEGYHFTASCSVEVARRVLQGEFKPGYQTPATAYGASLVQEIPGERVEIVDLD
ncbi:unnamed protein product, partial [Closterium sp. NIES-64]